MDQATTITRFCSSTSFAVRGAAGNCKVGVSYAGQLASSAHDHSVKGNFTWRF
jgi:hypothetical protein